MVHKRIHRLIWAIIDVSKVIFLLWLNTKVSSGIHVAQDCNVTRILLTIHWLKLEAIYNHYKGANDFSAYDRESTLDGLPINTFIGHADHNWDQRVQEKVIYVDFVSLKFQ